MKKKKAIWIIHSIHGIDNVCNLSSLLTVRDLSRDALTCSGQQRIALNSFISALKILDERTI